VVVGQDRQLGFELLNYRKVKYIVAEFLRNQVHKDSLEFLLQKGHAHHSQVPVLIQKLLLHVTPLCEVHQVTQLPVHEVCLALLATISVLLEL
jgi:hypothetical protein